jgi:two-component system, NarL family, sensor kinase
VSASGRRLWLAFAPALVGGLLLLQLVNLPLARSMVRRLGDSQRERERLLRRAVDASELERRRIAADLHDGVVQDLVGVSYTLSAEADRLENGDRPAAALRAGAAQARDSGRALRTLLVDIYPPSLHQAGLAATLGDLADTLSARGLATELHADDAPELPPDTEALLFRCAQEGCATPPRTPIRIASR